MSGTAVSVATLSCSVNRSMNERRVNVHQSHTQDLRESMVAFAMVCSGKLCAFPHCRIVVGYERNY